MDIPMKSKKGFYFSGVTIILMIFTLLLIPIPSSSQAGSIQIVGEVTLHNEYNLPFKIWCEFRLYDSVRRPITDAIITFNNKDGVPFNDPTGDYRNSFSDYPDDPNNLYIIAFRGGRSFMLPLKPEELKAEGRIRGRVNILSPTANQIINLAEGSAITIRWQLINASGYAINQIRVSETPYLGGPEGPVPVFFAGDYSGDTALISSSKLRPNKHYRIRIIIQAPLSAFKFSFLRGTLGALAPGSIIKGQYWTDRYFSTR
jgi:hypothetical protein